MIRAALASLALALASLACSVFVTPPYGYNCPWPDDDIARAEARFERLWQAHIGDNVHGYTRALRVRCIDDSDEIDSMSGYEYTAGFTDGYANIWLYTPDDRPVERTALFHELTHVLLQYTKHDPDSNHVEPPGPWTAAHDALIKRAGRHRP